jgi:hypothetical protein
MDWQSNIVLSKLLFFNYGKTWLGYIEGWKLLE